MKNCLKAIFAVLIALPSIAEQVHIPSGSFSMGSEEGQKDEQPRHTVSVSSFDMDEHEVTMGQYERCVKAGACTQAHYADGKCLMWTSQGPEKVTVPQKYRSPNQPAVCVTWHQARAYCRRQGMALPTEAQWEYAALAGSSNTYSWGNGAPSGKTNASAAERKPRQVKQGKPNNWGLYDMTGNVWEWTRDRYQSDYYVESPSNDPSGPSVGRYRVIRGGGWYSSSEQLRIKNRQWMVPEYGEVSLGFRCVK